MQKELILKILTKLGIKTSGLTGWLASIFLDKFIKYISKNGKKIYQSIKDKFANKKAEKVDEKNSNAYKEALKDGNTEQNLDNATSDLLNGRDK